MVVAHLELHMRLWDDEGHICDNKLGLRLDQDTESAPIKSTAGDPK
jgi:hypothetical protein